MSCSQVSQWHARGEENRIRSAIRDTFILSTVIVIPSFFGVLVPSEAILGIVFGQEFVIASVALIILMGEKVMQSIHVTFGRALQGINRLNLAAYATVVSVILNLLLNLLLIPQFGINGAVVATSVSFVANMALHGHFLSAHIELDFPVQETGLYLASAIPMSAILSRLKNQMVIQGIHHRVFLIILGAVLYCFFVSHYPPIRVKACSGFRATLG